MDLAVFGVPGYVFNPYESDPKLLIVVLKKVIGLVPVFPLRVALSLQVLIDLLSGHGDWLFLDHDRSSLLKLVLIYSSIELLDDLAVCPLWI